MLRQPWRFDPFNPALHYELGTALMMDERWDEARAALERSLELEPSQPNAYTTSACSACRTVMASAWPRQ